VTARGFGQGHAEFEPQPFAGHSEDVVDARFARRRLEVSAGATVQIEDVALPVDQRRGHADLFEQRLFGDIA
jgi:hypothetical protein